MLIPWIVRRSFRADITLRFRLHYLFPAKAALPSVWVVEGGAFRGNQESSSIRISSFGSAAREMSRRFVSPTGRWMSSSRDALIVHYALGLAHNSRSHSPRLPGKPRWHAVCQLRRAAVACVCRPWCRDVFRYWRRETKICSRERVGLGTHFRERDPNGIRTRVTAVKGRCPRPLDDRVRKAGAISEARPCVASYLRIASPPAARSRLQIQHEHGGSAVAPLCLARTA